MSLQLHTFIIPKILAEIMGSKSKGEKISDSALCSLRKFCTSYSLRKSDELLCRSLATLISGNYAALSNLAKEHLLNYFEAWEELLPAMYELQEHLNRPEPEEVNEEIYSDKVSAKDMYASFKRHPE